MRNIAIIWENNKKNDYSHAQKETNDMIKKILYL